MVSDIAQSELSEDCQEVSIKQLPLDPISFGQTVIAVIID